MKTFSVDPYGYKFATVCRTDGYWSITWLSKNKKAAARKGDEFGGCGYDASGPRDRCVDR